MYNLGSAEGDIVITYDGRGVDEAEADVTHLEDTAEKSSNKLALIGTAAAAALGVVATGFAAAVNSAANFEQRMSAISAVSGATGTELEAISDKALQLGADTVFSATEAASAMEELVKAGIPVEGVLNGAADAAVALAAAGEIGLPEAATIAANAMNQFGLAASAMPGIADKIAGAANASAISVSDFGQSMGQVGAVANLVGLSFEDTAQAIALMGNAGIKGSDAGTSLKSMLSGLQPVTDKQKETMRELGLVTEDGANQFFDAQGKIKSFADIADTLGASLEGMTDQQKTATLETLFGSDAIRAAAVVAEAGADGFNAMGEAMGKVTAADVAATRMDGLKGSIEQLEGSWETMLITVGGPFLDLLATGVDKMTDWVNAATKWADSIDIEGKLKAAQDFLFGVDRAVVGVTGKLEGTGTAAGTTLGLFGSIAKVVSTMWEQYHGAEILQNTWEWLQKVGDQIKAVFSGDADSKMGDNFQKLKDAVQGVNWAAIGSSISGFFSSAGGAAPLLATVAAEVEHFTPVLDLLAGSMDFLVEHTDEIIALLPLLAAGFTLAKIAQIGMNIAAAVSPGLRIAEVLANRRLAASNAQLVAAINAQTASMGVSTVATAENTVATNANGKASLVQRARTLAAAAAQKIAAAATAVATVAMKALNAVLKANPIGLVITAVLALIAIFVALYKNNEAFRKFVDKMWAGIMTAVKAVVDWFMTYVLPVIQTVVGAIVTAFQWLYNILIGNSIIPDIVNGIAKWFGLILGIVTPIFNAIKNFIVFVFNAIKAYFMFWFNLIKGIFTGDTELIKATLAAAWEAIKGVVITVWNAIFGFFKTIWANIKAWIATAIETIKTTLSNAWDSVKTTAIAAWQSLKDGVVEKGEALLTWVSEIPSNILGFFTGLGTDMYNAGKRILGMLWDGLKSVWRSIESWFTEKWQWVTDHLPGSPVKRGPLKVLNQGRAGGAIVEMLAGGMEDKYPLLARVTEAMPIGPWLTERRAMPMAGTALSPDSIRGTRRAQPNEGSPVHLHVDARDYNTVPHESSYDRVREITKTARYGFASRIRRDIVLVPSDSKGEASV